MKMLFYITVRISVKTLFTLCLLLYSISTQPAIAITPTHLGLEKDCPTGGQECALEYFKNLTKGLCVEEIITVDPKYWQESRKAYPLPAYKQAVNMPKEIPLDQIRFMQDSASGDFSDDKHDIIEIAQKIRDGQKKVTDLPPIEVWLDDHGNIWTTNHRRLITMLISGVVQKAPVIFVDQAVVQQNAYEFTTTNEGSKIIVKLTDQLGMVVGHTNRCAKAMGKLGKD